ncbi:MAG: tetratricopeptide repeat protein [Planctomycetota bacterium]
MSKESKARRTERRHAAAEARRARHSPRGREPARPARWPRYGAVALLIVLVGVAGYLGWQRLRPVPAVVSPREPDALDPQFRAYVKGFIESVQAAPRDAGRHATLGLVYEANQLYPEAQASFRTAVELDPDEPLAKYHLALTTQEVGDADAGLAMLQQLARQHPDFAPGQHRLGDTLLEAGDIEGASLAFMRVIEQAPGEPDGYVGLADARLQAGEYVRAVELLTTALRLRPNDGMARFLLGTAYQRLGRQDEAARELSRGAQAGKRPMTDAWSKQMPQHAKDLSRQSRRALAFLRAGAPQRAAELYEVILAWHPENVDMMNNLALAYMDLRQLDKARDVLLRAERANNTRYATYTNLAFCHIRLGELDQALQFADRAVALAPNVAQTHRIRGRCLKELDRVEEAIAALETTVSLDPQNAIYRQQLGGELARAGRFAEAKQQFEVAVRTAPSDLQAHLGLCNACLNLGQADEARAALSAAKRLAPNDPRVAATAIRLAESGI